MIAKHNYLNSSNYDMTACCFNVFIQSWKSDPPLNEVTNGDIIDATHDTQHIHWTDTFDYTGCELAIQSSNNFPFFKDSSETSMSVTKPAKMTLR